MTLGNIQDILVIARDMSGVPVLAVIGYLLFKIERRVKEIEIKMKYAALFLPSQKKEEYKNGH